MRSSVFVALIVCCLVTPAFTQTLTVGGNDFSDSSIADGLIKKAQAFYKASDYANSLKALEDALKFCPGNARLHLEAAFNKQATGDYGGAKLEIITANRSYPKLGFIFYLSGLVRLKTRDFYGVITDMSMSIYIAPHVTLPYLPRGLARHELGDYQGAVEDFTVLINSPHPDGLGLAYYYRGFGRFELDDSDGALADLTSAIGLDPTNTGAYFIRSMQHKVNGNIAAAINDCNAALTIKPGIAHIITARAWLYHELSDFKSAEGDADLLIKDGSDSHPTPWLDRGSIYDAEDRIELAIESYRKGISLAEEKSAREPWVYGNFCLDLLCRRTKKPKSIEYLKDVLEWPDDWPKRIGIYLAGHTSDESLERHARNTTDLLLKQKQACEAYYYIGMINIINGSKSTAQDYFKKAVNTKQVKLVEYNLAREQLRRLHTEHD